MTLRDHRTTAAEASWTRALLRPAADKDKHKWIAERRARVTRARRRLDQKKASER